MNSIVYQGLVPGDDVLVVGDGYHKATAELVEMMGKPFRYVATEKTRDWGHSQVNYGLKHVGGDWLLLQDDDDIFLPRAFDEARHIISKLESPRPVIGRVMTPYLGILWTEPGREPLDGHCLLVPNDKEKLGYVGLEYEGDQTWLATNMTAYETYSWADRIWTLTRPTGKLWPRRMGIATYRCFSPPPLWESCAWNFHRDQGGVWSEEYVATLIMDWWDTNGEVHWGAQLSRVSDVTDEEFREIIEFAAWAGQGTDVWFLVDESRAEVMNAAGYQFHQTKGSWMEFVFEWPPHRFEPKEKTP